MEDKNKLNSCLNFIKIITLTLISIMLVIIIIRFKDINNNNNRTNTYISWCKNEYKNIENPTKKEYQNKIIKCVKGWNKIDRQLKK